MATVNVTSWAEFLEAAAVSGDTVVCPENAVWDIAEIEPEGHSGSITFASDVVGNGTTIKNLVLTGIGIGGSAFDATGGTSTQHRSISGLNIINATFEVASANIFIGNYADFELCTFSMLARGANKFVGDACNVYRCAANIETTAGTFTIGGNNAKFDYFNCKISGSGLTAFRNYPASYSNRSAKVNNSYIILDTPSITTLAFNAGNSNVFRCTGANVTSLTGYTATSFSLAVDTDFPNLTSASSGWKFVTEAQLRDAAYLQSIGFPIGV